MDYSFFNQQTTSYPSVYKIQLNHPNELLTLYSSEILPNTPICKVESELAEYVTTEIEPTGWKAIWRASTRVSGLSFKCDFLVSVIDVSRSQLESTIVIERPLSIQLDELDDDSEEKNGIYDLIKNRRVLNVPIYELYIINENDEEELLLKSAIIIENVRFFMKFIWRPWDTIANETQLNEIFVETRLESRLNLYFDVQNCLLNDSQIKRIKHILTDGWRLRNQLDDIVKKQELESANDNNTEYVIDELDMSEAIRLKIRLEDYDREMRMIEDPYLRPFTFYLKVDLNDENVANEEESIDADEEMCKQLIHIVSNSKINLNSLQLINSYYSDDETSSDYEFEFHQNLNDAIKAAKKFGNRIAILPGQYCFENVTWIDYDLQIEGLSKSNDDISIESSAFIDVLIHCSSNIVLKNLTLKCPSRDLTIPADQFLPFRKSDKINN